MFIDRDAVAGRQKRTLRLTSFALRSSVLGLAVAMATPAVSQISEGPAANAPSAPTPGAVTPVKTGAPIETTAPVAAVADNDRIGDIVVTARRVQERLQDIPASVSAITGDQVARMDTLANIQNLVSGVTFQAYGPIPTVGIRGFGNRTQAGNATNSTVGIFQDGVFVAPPLVVDINRIDTERVEVAKGPQSTLYGRSSFTGAINIVSNDPAKTFSGYLDGGYGGSSVASETLWHVRGAVNLPLTDTLSVRLFGLREKRDGFTYDAVTGYRGGGYDRTAGRIRILWQPSDVFTARLTGTILHDNLPLDLTHTGRSIPPLGEGNLFASPFVPQSALQFGRTVWDAIYTTPQSSNTRGQQVTLDLRAQTPIGEFASLTDYQHSYQDVLTNLDLTRVGYAHGDTLFRENRFSQELRLSNKIDRLNYLFGLYYLHNEARQGGGETLDPAHPFAAFGPGAALFDFAHFNALYQPIYTKTDAYAAFGQVGYDFSDRLNLTLGLRQSRDELSGPTGTFFRTTTGFFVPSQPYTQRRGSFDATTGMLTSVIRLNPTSSFTAAMREATRPAASTSAALRQSTMRRKTSTRSSSA